MAKFEYEGEIYDTKTLHTKQLLNLLKKIRTGSICECCHPYEWIEWRLELDRRIVPILKEELARREHIPNHFEAKTIRKKKVIEQKNKKNKKYRNHR